MSWAKRAASGSPNKMAARAEVSKIIGDPRESLGETAFIIEVGGVIQIGTFHRAGGVLRQHSQRAAPPHHSFLGTSGHHDNSGMSGHWLADHKEEMFAKTALIINCEHTSAEQLIYRGGVIRRTNTTVPLRWYVGGSARLEQIVVKAYDAFGIATYAEPEPSAARWVPTTSLLHPSS